MRFTLNGTPVDLPADRADDRLLWVLRDDFALNGPKYGCGVGACGACVVHVDGEAQRACLLTVKHIANRAVTTLEGLGVGHADNLHQSSARGSRQVCRSAATARTARS